MRDAISTLFKRSTLVAMSLVLALSTVVPIASATVASAATSGPLTVESVCNDGKVTLQFTLQESTPNWVSGDVYYKTPYGNSNKHSLPSGDLDNWSVATGLRSAPSVSVKADVYGLVTKSSFPFIDIKAFSYNVATDALDCRQLNGENFNTVDTPYRGISVGFNTEDFGTVTAASVAITRADGSVVTKTANQGVLDLITNGATMTQLTAPFVIQDGTFTEASDTQYWAPVAPVASWTAATTPVKATVSVTDEYGTKTVEITNFSQGAPSWPTYQSLLPVAPTAPPTRPALSGDVIYDSIPGTLPSNSPSLGYQATSTRAFGDKISFGGTARSLDKVAVNMSSWACESGTWNNNCVTTPGATFTHPITINIYNVASDGTVGTLIDSRTQTFTIPYRPTADPTCASQTQWRDTNGNCFNGMNHMVVFDASGITVPETVIYSISYDTQSYGSNPIGSDGPYNALNVALSTTATVGVNVNTDEVFWDTTYPGYTAGLKADSGWAADGSPAIVFTAKAVTPPADNGSGSSQNPSSDSGNIVRTESSTYTKISTPSLFGFANGFGSTVDDSGSSAGTSDVLGTTTQNNDEDNKVLGADKTTNGNNTGWTMPWYGWIIAVALLGGLGWWLVAGYRRQ